MNAFPSHWFVGDGMLQAWSCATGARSEYRNRWVRTRSFVEDAKMLRALTDAGRSCEVGVTTKVIYRG